MSQIRRTRTLDLGKLIRVATGLGLVSAGWLLYSNNGFETTMMFLLGFLMVPLGIILIGRALVRITG